MMRMFPLETPGVFLIFSTRALPSLVGVIAEHIPLKVCHLRNLS